MVFAQHSRAIPVSANSFSPKVVVNAMGAGKCSFFVYLRTKCGTDRRGEVMRD
jgi:hypothetical protein